MVDPQKYKVRVSDFPMTPTVRVIPAIVVERQVVSKERLHNITAACTLQLGEDLGTGMPILPLCPQDCVQSSRIVSEANLVMHK